MPVSLAKLIPSHSCLLAAAIFAAVFWTTSEEHSSADDWPQHRGTAARTAFSATQLPADMHSAWSRELGEPIPAWPRSDRVVFDHAPVPVVAAGCVLVASTRDDSLRAIDVESGRLRWQWHTSAPIRFAPAVWEDRAFVASDDGWLYALRVKDGALLWKIRGGPGPQLVIGNERVISRWPVRGGPVVHNGRVYFAAGIWPSDGIYLYAVDAGSGKVIWQNSDAGAIYMGQPHGGAYAESGIAAQGYLVISGEHLLVPTGRAVPAAFRLADGKFEYFHLQKYGHRGGTPTMAVDGVFFNSGLSFAAKDGQQVAQVGSGALAADQERIYRAAGGKLTAYHWETVEGRDRKGKPIQVRKLVPEWAAPIPSNTRCLAVAGGECVLGGTNFVAIYSPAQEKIRWQAKAPGDVRQLAVADNCLVAATSQGVIACFRSGTMPLAQSEAPRAPTPHPPAATIALAKRLIRDVGRSSGWVVDLDAGDGLLSYALATQGPLKVVAVASSDSQAAQLRRLFDATGLLGHCVAVWQRRPTDTELPSYCADLVVSGRLQDEVSEEWLVEARRLCRPHGGIVCWGNAAAPKLFRRGSLPGAGTWTHQYADAANSLNSRDQLVGGQLSVSWFRDLDFEVPQRHGRGPAPLFADGRVFHEGLHGVVCVNAYNGAELWRYDIPEVLTAYNGDELMGVAGTGSNMCLGSGRLFVRHDQACEVLDVETGKRLAQYSIDQPWGFVATANGRLFGSAADPEHIVTYRYVNRGGDMSKLLTESKELFAIDIESGERLWQRQAEHSFRHNAIAITADRVFVIDRPQARFDRVKKPTSREHPFGTLLALDAQTGEVLWRNHDEIFGTVLIAVPERDVLVMCYQPTRFRLDSEVGGRIAAFRASDGQRLWDIKAQYASRPLIRQDTIYAQGGAWDLETGKPRPFPFQRSYGCGVLAASERLLVFRSATLGYFEFDADEKTRNYGGMRPGCWINALPVGGMVVIPDASAGCQCSYLNRCWLALQPADAASP